MTGDRPPAATPREHAEPAARAWMEHLLQGGTTSWADWMSSHPVIHDGSVTHGGGHPGRLPGAAQLELVRRLALRAGGDRGRRFTALADRVLARSGPGRGLPDLPLAWPGEQPGSRTPSGVPPMDPADVPSGELVRAAVGVLAELLAGVTPRPPTTRPGRRRPFSRAFVLAGAPVTTARLRAGFAATGLLEGGRNPHVLLVTVPIDEALREAWTARVRHRSEARWPAFVARCARTGRLPESVDLPRLAAAWAERVGPERVHVLAPTHDAGSVRRTAAEVLRLPVPAEAPPTAPATPAEVDLVRRLNAVLKVRVEPARHQALLDSEVPALFDPGRADPSRLRVPPPYRAWARERAEDLAERLTRGGYAVHGDLHRLAGSGSGRPRPPRDRVLDVALTACLRAAERWLDEEGEVRT